MASTPLAEFETLATCMPRDAIMAAYSIANHRRGSDPATFIACVIDRLLTKQAEGVLGLRTWAPGLRRTWLSLGAAGLGAPVPPRFAPVVPLLPPVPLNADT
jgi:hypothetical protein